jgi:hypothetical protein
MRPDPIRDLVQRLVAASRSEGGLTDEVALAIEDAFRQYYAGEHIYVVKRLKLDGEDLNRMRDSYLKEPAETVADRHGISRRHLYRLMKGR